MKKALITANLQFLRTKRLKRSVSRVSDLPHLVISTLANRYKLGKPPIVYIGDSDWVLSTIGHSIRQHLGRYYSFRASSAWGGIRRSLVHFAAPPAYFDKKAYHRIHPSNKQVVTWTHGQRSNPNQVFTERLDNVCEAAKFVDKVIATSRIGANTLLMEGLNQDKLVHIPLGIDTTLFHPPTHEQRADIRRQMDIPETAYCIGSFQKDGEGWEEGLSPKWVKGPDTFLEVIERLRHNYELCVLLTAPARGYVKKGLGADGGALPTRPTERIPRGSQALLGARHLHYRLTR